MSPSGPYLGPERRVSRHSAEAERAEIAMRLLITAERLERLASRLEAYVSTPSWRGKTSDHPI